MLGKRAKIGGKVAPEYPMLLNVLTLIASFCVLLFCGHLFVTGAVGIAERNQIPKIIVGTLLVSMGTTLPELAVSVQSAVMGYSNLALGNAIGSVIADDALAFGLAAVVAPLPFMVHKKFIKPSAFVLLGSVFLLYVFSLNGTINRAEGIVFLVILATYFTWFIHYAKSQRNLLLEEKLDVHIPKTSQRSNPFLFFIFTVGLAGVFISSRGVIWAATGISRHLGISEIIIGLTVVAIGTSLPEVTTCVIAALKKEGDIAAGDIIGADILNILWIIGMSATAHPLTAETKTLHFYGGALLIVVGVFLSILLFTQKIRKTHGLVLFILYLLFISLSYTLFR